MPSGPRPVRGRRPIPTLESECPPRMLPRPRAHAARQRPRWHDPRRRSQRRPFLPRRHDLHHPQPALVRSRPRRRHRRQGEFQGTLLRLRVAEKHRKKCYISLVENLNVSDVECIKYSVSKGLGIGIVVGGSIMKVPQLLLSASSLFESTCEH